MASKIIAITYFTVLIYLTFFLDIRYHDVDYRSYTNLIPLKNKIEHIGVINFHKDPIKNYYLFFVEIIGNFILFVPFCGAFKAVNSEWYKKANKLLVIIILALTIEITQYVFNIGVMDADDFLLNVFGGSFGFYLFNYLKSPKKHTD